MRRHKHGSIMCRKCKLLSRVSRFDFTWIRMLTANSIYNQWLRTYTAGKYIWNIWKAQWKHFFMLEAQMSIPMTVAMAMKIYLLASLTLVNRMQYSCDMIFIVQNDTYFLRSFDNSNWRRGLNPELMRSYPDIKIHGANTGPTWLLSASGGPHVGPMNIAFIVCMVATPTGQQGHHCSSSVTWSSTKICHIDKLLCSRWWQSRCRDVPLSGSIKSFLGFNKQKCMVKNSEYRSKYYDQ